MRENRRRNAFLDCHPTIQFFYFIIVILTTMLITHPVILGFSFLGGLLYHFELFGIRKTIKKQIIFVLPMFIVVSLINPAFNHYGTTMLFYTKTGPVTLEAIIYGIVLSGMLWIAIIWFSNLNYIMTTDKYVYLFGRIMPSFSLMLSMVFRFVPRFKHQLQKIREGQRCLGHDIVAHGPIKRIRYGVRILSMLITWSLESGIDTADSMKARGYGTTKRTSFSIYEFGSKDRVCASILCVLYAICFTGIRCQIFRAQYNPVIKISGFSDSVYDVLSFAAWIGICLFPVVYSLLEKLLFHIKIEKELR